MNNKSFPAESPVPDDSLVKKHKKPIGGIAVLPPMDIKKIEEARRSPIERPRSKSPATGVGQDSTGYSSTQRASHLNEGEVSAPVVTLFKTLFKQLHLMIFKLTKTLFSKG